MIKAIKEEIKELPKEIQEAHAKDKKHATIGTTAIATSALGSAALEVVNESLPTEWFASAGIVGFVAWGITKVLMLEAESGLEHLLE